MLWALLLGLLVSQEPTGIIVGRLCDDDPVARQPTTLLVEVVGPVWDTLPGVTVTVIPRSDRKIRHTATTDHDGIARFSVPKNAEYEIEAALTGFKKGRMKSVRLVFGTITESNGRVRQAPPPRVQIRLELSGPYTVIQ